MPPVSGLPEFQLSTAQGGGPQGAAAGLRHREAAGFRGNSRVVELSPFQLRSQLPDFYPGVSRAPLRLTA